MAERWSSWVAEQGSSSSTTDAYSLTLWQLTRKVVPELTAEGFDISSRRSLEHSLTMGLPDLETLNSRGGTSKTCSFFHFLNLLWQPILSYVEDLAKGHQPAWTKTIQTNHDALVLEMAGVVLSADTAMPIDEWHELLRDTLLRLVDVSVPLRLIKEVVSPLAPLDMETTAANAMHVLRSSVCCQLVGPSLAAQVNRLILAEITELPVPLLTAEQMSLGVKTDLVASLEQLHCKPELEEPGDEGPPAKKFRRNSQSIAENMASKTKQALWVLQNNMCLSKAKQTLTSAKQLIQDLEEQPHRDPSGPSLEDLMVSRYTLARHMLFLDGAMDRVASENLWAKREAGDFAGVALATDESPPSQPRFRGLRFQITVLYLGTYLPVEHWERCASPPISSTSLLGDIMHCPGKKGVDVSRVIEKQLLRCCCMHRGWWWRKRGSPWCTSLFRGPQPWLCPPSVFATHRMADSRHGPPNLWPRLQEPRELPRGGYHLDSAERDRYSCSW